MSKFQTSLTSATSTPLLARTSRTAIRRRRRSSYSKRGCAIWRRDRSFRSTSGQCMKTSRWRQPRPKRKFSAKIRVWPIIRSACWRWTMATRLKCRQIYTRIKRWRSYGEPWRKETSSSSTKISIAWLHLVSITTKRRRKRNTSSPSATLNSFERGQNKMMTTQKCVVANSISTRRGSASTRQPFTGREIKRTFSESCSSLVSKCFSSWPSCMRWTTSQLTSGSSKTN